MNGSEKLLVRRDGGRRDRSRRFSVRTGAFPVERQGPHPVGTGAASSVDSKVRQRGVSAFRCCPLLGASAALDRGRSCLAFGEADMECRFADAALRMPAPAPPGTRD